jgi:bla regulator protein BlaR1
MNSLIEWLNVWGGRFVDFARPLLWQTSLLIAVVFAFDFLLRRNIRAAVRYSLWFVVFLKLLLPPTLALPTGAAWWLRSRPVPVVVHHARMITVNYSEPVEAYVPPTIRAAPVPPPAPTLSREGWMLLVASAFSVFLAMWVLLRWRQIARCLRRTTGATVELAEMLAEARRLAGLRKNVTLRVTPEAMSPAVCGLFRPVILLPQSLIEKLTPIQLRAVLLHELIHLRRRDVWVNCAQTLLQIVYWWNPLLWIANARMRRVREEAVDDAVMCALSTEAEVYAPTLLEVAKLAFARPLASLGLVGILESRSALRHRIERLLNFTTPRRAGVSMVSVICLAAFTALAVPMGEPPARPSQAPSDDIGAEKLIPYRAKVNSEVFMRNVQARAQDSMHATNDDLNVILISIMDGFGVDCTDERAIRFDQATGEVTAKNTSEALSVLDEVVKELNLKGGEHVLNPPHGLKQVLIEGQFYLVKPDQNVRLQLTSPSLHQRGEMTPWWGISPTDAENFRQQLSDQGVKPISSPRIQTTHGITAGLSVGDAASNIQLECVPYIHDGIVTLTVLARTTGEYAPEGKSWPDIYGHTNCAIFSRLTLTNGGTAMFSAKPAGANANLVVLLTAKILTPTTNVSSQATGYNWYKTNSTTLNSPVAQLVQDGKLLYQLGKMDEAELKLQEALAQDPSNQAAQYYLNLIKQSRAKGNDTIGGARARNVPGPGAPPEVTVKVRFVEINDEDMFKPGFEWFLKMMAINGTNGLTGILTDPLFRTVLKNIEQRKGADLLNEGEVTTLSGRQANFQVIEIDTNQATASSEQTTNTPFGTSLDVVPYVEADGYTIQSTLIPTITERVEYPISGNFVPTIQSGNGGIPITGQLPLPRVRVRQTVVNCTVWDGQTAVLLLEPYVPHQKNVVVFVTTTIIDPSGNRKNSEESLPFAQKAIPPQPVH